MQEVIDWYDYTFPFIQKIVHARKTTAKKTPPKKQTQTTHAKVVEDELVEDDDAIEDVASRNEKNGKVVLGKRKGVVIQESENEAFEPRQIVALKKENGKRAMAKEKEGIIG
ncbi:hypothetical protein KSS87_017605 [Heliosperma pusillum]|nr:hypothetical protein KSS87_017605 [Heliosperma pusillum]